MKGYKLVFYTRQDRQHGHQPLAHWLVEESQRLGFGGATLSMAAEGFGHDGKMHSAGFFELGDQPVQVCMAVTEEEADLFRYILQKEGINIFYMKIPIEFGMTSDA
ncbi:DUF190 domain-containing protein [Oxalobacter sp. OttesenSCG-928-P03]|nr:DUF190 domain-containing protein [Oxalobacter sp. OttesenSCG-928-P03]